MKKSFILLAASIFITGAIYAQPKIIFSNNLKPSNTNSKESFASNENIYGSIDLGGKTIKEYFKLPDFDKNYPYAYLYYVVEVYKGDVFIGDNNWNIMFVREADKKNTILNFDVLPDPAKATTVLSGVELFDAGLASAPLYVLIQRQFFKESGTYNIRIRMYNKTLDAYGNNQPYDKWPTCAGSFSFVFNENDVPLLLKNADAAELTAKKAFKR